MLWPISTFQEGTFHELSRTLTVVTNVFSKPFKGKIFVNSG